MADSPSIKPARGWLFRNLKSLSVMASMAGLLTLNAATVMNSTMHDVLFSGVQKALLFLGADVADGVLSKSPTVRAKQQIAVATKAMKDEVVDLKATNKKLNGDFQDLRVKHDKEISAASVRAKSTKEIASNVQKRLAKGVARNIAALPAEAVPYLGVGVTLAVTSLDIYDACTTMKEINGLLVMLGQGEENTDFCGVKVPTLAEVLKSAKTGWKTSVDTVLTEAREAPGAMLKALPQPQLPSRSEIISTVCPLITMPRMCS